MVVVAAAAYTPEKRREHKRIICTRFVPPPLSGADILHFQKAEVCIYLVRDLAFYF